MKLHEPKSYVKLKNEKVEKGDYVRSYDFCFNDEASSDCYYEGEVEEVVEKDVGGNAFDCPRYRIKVAKRVWEGNEEELEHKYVYPPVNGTEQWLSDYPTMCVQKAKK